MILFKIKETDRAHQFRPRVVLQRDDGLDARKCTLHILSSDPGVMNKSNRVHARIHEFCQAGGEGGEGVEARRPENSMDNVF